jgi:dihydroxyacetone kinase-like predicted kinase
MYSRTLYKPHSKKFDNAVATQQNLQSILRRIFEAIKAPNQMVFFLANKAYAVECIHIKIDNHRLDVDVLYSNKTQRKSFMKTDDDSIYAAAVEQVITEVINSEQEFINDMEAKKAKPLVEKDKEITKEINYNQGIPLSACNGLVIPKQKLLELYNQAKTDVTIGVYRTFNKAAIKYTVN